MLIFLYIGLGVLSGLASLVAFSANRGRLGSIFMILAIIFCYAAGVFALG